MKYKHIDLAEKIPNIYESLLNVWLRERENFFCKFAGDIVTLIQDTCTSNTYHVILALTLIVLHI